MAPPTDPRPYVGVAVIILRNSPSSTTTTTPSSPSTTPQILLGKRLGSHGANTWALPGGHLEFNESFETCATRETLEETGLTVKNVRYLTTTNDVMTAEGKHYVTVFVVCERDSEEVEPVVCEVEKCAGWMWVEWDEVRKLAYEEKNKGEGEIDLREQQQGINGQVKEEKTLFLPLKNLVLDREKDVLKGLSC